MTWTVSFLYEIFLSVLTVLILEMGTSLAYHCYSEMGWEKYYAVFSYKTKNINSISDEKYLSIHFPFLLN